MIPAALAWGLAIVFGAAGVEKLARRETRRNFFAAATAFLPSRAGAWPAVGFVAGELAVIPLLLAGSRLALDLLVVLSFLVGAFAALFLRRDEGCGCGGLWAASGRNLLFRNLFLLAVAVYVHGASPVPVPVAALPYALLGMAAWIVLAAVGEALRIRKYSR